MGSLLPIWISEFAIHTDLEAAWSLQLAKRLQDGQSPSSLLAMATDASNRNRKTGSNAKRFGDSL